MASGQGYALIGPAGREDADLYLGKDTIFPHPTAFRAPGTALWGLLAGADPSWFKLINVALGAGTCALIFLILESTGAALSAGLLWAFYPSAVFATTLYGSEALYVFFLTLTAWLLSRLPSGRASGRQLAFIGLCVAWSCLIRPPAIVLLAPVLAALWNKSRKETLRRGALVAGFVALGILPWTARNWVLFHRFVPIATSHGIAFGLRTAYHRPNAVPRTEAGDEPSLSDQGWNNGVENLKETFLAGPVVIARSVADNLDRAFGSDSDVIQWATLTAYDPTRRPQPDENRAISANALAGWLLFNHFFYAGLLMLALAGLAFSAASHFLSDRGVWFLLFHLLLMCGMLILVPGLNRYHFSMMVPVVMLAGLGIDGLGKRLFE